MNVYERINEVRKQVHYAKKDKEVTGQGYKAVTHDAVTALVRNQLIEHGIVIVPRLMSSDVKDIGNTKNGAVIIRYAGRYEIDFVNCEAPADKVTVSCEAHANDSGDKAPGKATSYATKGAILKLFSIETGEDDESRVEPYSDIELISAEQAKSLDALLTEVGADKSQFLEYIKAVVLEEIPAKYYDRCLQLIEAKRNAKKKPKAEPVAVAG